jgi:GNAT superfamily N-acetyltransferase
VGTHRASIAPVPSARFAGRQHALAAPRIEPLAPTPARLRGTREELNQLTYGPSTVLVARRDDALLGAVRYAVRDDPRRPHGLIADLQVDAPWRDGGVADALIDAAERALAAAGVVKIDALVEDGQGWAPIFYRHGYWASRKSVVMRFDLRRWDASDAAAAPAGVGIELVERPDVDEVTRLVLDSYQPYWRWWREHARDRRWVRVDFPAHMEPPASPGLERAMRARVRARLRRLGDDPDHVLFLARVADGQLVGLCDAARRPPEGDLDQVDFGVLVVREFGGKRLGSALLRQALAWLRAGGLASARVTTPSGLDDYDPTVYLYNLAFGAQILCEFVDLVKHPGAEPVDPANSDAHGG